MNFPSVVDTLASSTVAITGIFNFAWPAVIVIVGVILGGVGIHKFAKVVMTGVKTAIGAGGRRRGRRGRR